MDGSALLTPLASETPEIDEPDNRTKRAAYATNYYERCQELASNLNLENLRAVVQALSKVDGADIDVEEAENLVQRLGPLLSLHENDHRVVLNACQLVVKLRVRKPESLWMSSADVAERAALSFRDLSLQLASSSNLVLPEFTQVIDSWTALVKQGKLEDHLSFPIISSGLQWIFGENRDANQDARASFVSFIAAGYSHISQALQDQMLHEVLSAWFRHSCSSSKEVSNTLMELMLSLVAAAGEVPIPVWEEAMALKSRSNIELVSQARHGHAISVANLISRRLIDFTWAAAKTSSQRAGFHKFLESCGAALLSSQWPAAEVFVSALVSSLLRLATVIHNQKYPGFMFDSLHTLYDALAALNMKSEAAGHSDPHSDTTEIACRAITLCLDDFQAIYLASRQNVLPNQPFYDLFDAYSRRSTSIGSLGTFLDRQLWIRVLAQYPISGYRAKIVRLACELASNEELKEQHQVELFRLIEKIVQDDISQFEIDWLSRVSYATPAVCDALVPVAASAYKQSANIEILRRICSRVLGPGALHYKRRVLSLLQSAAIQEVGSLQDTRPETYNYDATALACRHFLIAATDNDASVKSLALSLAQHWFNASFESEIAEILVQTQSGPDWVIVRRGLQEYMKEIRKAKNGDTWVKKLVNQLLAPENTRLDLALTFIEIDGGFTPLSSVSFLHELSSSADEKTQLLSLKILDYALRARPRLILAPSLASCMFAKLLMQLRTCSEVLMIHIGSILGQLVGLGGPAAQEHRTARLMTVTQSAFKMAQRMVDLFRQSGLTSQQALIMRQSVLICGCAQLWRVPGNIAGDIALSMVQWMSIDGIDSALKFALVRSIFRLSIESLTLLSEPRLVAFFDSFREGSPEYSCLTRQLLRFMLENDRSQGARNCDYLGDKFYKLSTNEDIKRADAAKTLMVQRHVSKLLQLVQNDRDVLVLRIVTKAVEDNLLVADECIPVITSLCLSTKPELAQIALRSLLILCERWPRNFGIKFVEGLRLVSNNGGQAVSHSALPFMWHIIKKSQRNLKPMLNPLAQLFNDKSSFELLRLLIAGLSNVEMDTKDAKYLVLRIEDEVNRFNPEEHESPGIAKIILVYVFALWMRRRYGLSESGQVYGASAGGDEELDTMDTAAIWSRFSNSGPSVRQVLKELWRLPDYYGTSKMNSLIYGGTKRGKHEDSAAKKIKH